MAGPKLTVEGASILDAMIEQRGFATYGALMTAAGVERGYGDGKTLRAHVDQLKTALKPFGVPVIDMYGLGFGITMASLPTAMELRRGKKRGRA